jgi:N-acetylglucosaminyldiphosphoundecaprenol N-acetyl-beta-D-mannosaminyltransferase
MIFYRKLVGGGMTHPTAVFAVSAVCGVCGVSMAVFQMGLMSPLAFFSSLILICAGLYIAVARANGREDSIAVSRPSLWGIVVDNISLDYALGRVVGWLSSRSEPRMIVTVDALASLRSRSDKSYSKMVREADMSLPDGTGLIWALRFIGSGVQEQISGVDFVDHLCRVSAGHGWSVFFFGGRPGVAEAASEKLREKYDALRIAGCRHGYFKQEESCKIAEDIKKSGANILIAALGVPMQEKWLSENLPKLGGVVGIGVGGSFDVISGRLKRAPLRWRRMKLEWLYRTIQEPARWRRAAKLPLFALLVLMKKMRLDMWRDLG